MSFQTRRFIPRLVALDDRSLPSAMISLTGSTLSITGDAGADNIVIQDDGTASGITVITADGTWTATGDVSAIVVNTGGGNDTVEYDLTGDLTTTRLVSVDLGKGADAFTVNLNQHTISGASTNLGITSSGDGGGDALTLNANGATVSPEAHMSVDFSGNAGKDAIAFNYDPGFLDQGNVTLTKDQKH